MVAKKSAKKQVGINVKIPADIHRRLRVLCVENGWTLSEAVTEALARFL
jgi:hypothetical protein